MPRRLLSILTIIVAVLVSASAQSDAVETYVRGEMQKQRIPGLSLAVVKEGKVIKTAGYGLANIEQDVAATPDTVYKIGSVSKQFLASGIMILVQDGKLALTDPVSKHLEGTPETWKDVTIWHLLTHTSGIVREGPAFNPAKVQSDFDVIKSAYPLPLIFPTGKGWQYCNVGYFALAEIISRSSGKPWPVFFEERVFKQTGMTASWTTAVSNVPKRAIGYFRQNEIVKVAPDYLAVRPSGAFLSTVLDLAKWDAALYTNKVLTAPTREQMWKPGAQTTNKSADGQALSYGFGWFIEEFKGRRLVQHGGSLPGFRASMLRFVDDKLTIIVLTNGDEARPDAIARGVANLFLGATKAASGVR